MKKTSIESLAREDAFQLIGKEWMLITAGTLEKHNMMTASWGGIGWLWNKPVAFIFVRPERFTYPLIEENEHLTLSFLGNDEKMRQIYNFCGTKSGRDFDKTHETGLTPVMTEHGAVAFLSLALPSKVERCSAANLSPRSFSIKKPSVVGTTTSLAVLSTQCIS